MKIYKHYNAKSLMTLFNGDCQKLLKEIPNETVDLIITSPPYCMKKAYEDPKADTETFKELHTNIFDDIYRILKPGGSICWQIGYHVSNSSIIPLDYLVYEIFTSKNDHLEYPLILRNRIIWTFGHGLNSTQRFSGRHEMIMWFTKGEAYNFNLDCVRVPQKYPGKRHYKGEHKGELSGNPYGKNPSDVWDIPNVKANHIEKTEHPCQFPVAIPQRLIRALTNEADIILDPFMGSGTTALATFVEKRKFIGAEIKQDYYNLTTQRIKNAIKGDIKIRDDIPVMTPNTNMSVAKLPEEFRLVREEKNENE
ncbi:MAG: site-specific DNA-methyltransferase [Kiritimatiellae bacterium]|nr:site-specific DNA-methyltransferase [Kiritimatiellia bacterium]